MALLLGPRIADVAQSKHPVNPCAHLEPVCYDAEPQVKALAQLKQLIRLVPRPVAGLSCNHRVVLVMSVAVHRVLQRIGLQKQAVL